MSEQCKVIGANVKRITEQIGVIHTSFYENYSPDFEGTTDFPSSYVSVTPKERLLLLFAENFRRQFSEIYPNRKPPILAVANECGIQVMIIYQSKNCLYFQLFVFFALEICVNYSASDFSFISRVNKFMGRNVKICS